MKTHDLSPSHNYIIGSHPHGILCVGAFCNFITGSTGFEELFPGIRSFLTTLAGNFRLPVFREYLMSGGERCLPCPVPAGLPRAGGSGRALVPLGETREGWYSGKRQSRDAALLAPRLSDSFTSHLVCTSPTPCLRPA